MLVIVGLVGCAQKTNMPTGFSNKDFYSDMLECTELSQKTLGTKNVAYIEAIGTLLNKYIESSTIPDADIKDVFSCQFSADCYRKRYIAHKHLFIF